MKPVHKFKRRLKEGDQYILCSWKKANMKEKNLSYFWDNVTCKKCRKLGGK